MKAWVADFALLCLTAIWGLSFPLIHGVMQANFPAMAFLAIRFTIATVALALTLVVWRKRFLFKWWKPTLILGVLMFSGFIFQTLGLQLTTSARAAFITGLSVVLTPVFEFALLKRAPTLQLLASLALAVAGLVVMATAPDASGSSNLQSTLTGDLLVLVCAIGFAAYIVAVPKYAMKLPATEIATGQAAVVALSAWMLVPVSGGITMPSVESWGVLIFLGLIATALVTAAQIELQKYTTPTRAALMFVLEPVFAAVFAWMLEGERLTREALWGGALMLVAAIFASIPLGKTQAEVSQTN